MKDPATRLVLAAIFACLGYLAAKLLLDGAPGSMDAWIGTFCTGIVIGGATVLFLNWARRRKQAAGEDRPQR